MKNPTPSAIRNIQKAATPATLAVTSYYVAGCCVPVKVTVTV